MRTDYKQILTIILMCMISVSCTNPPPNTKVPEKTVVKTEQTKSDENLELDADFDRGILGDAVTDTCNFFGGSNCAQAGAAVDTAVDQGQAAVSQGASGLVGLAEGTVKDGKVFFEGAWRDTASFAEGTYKNGKVWFQGAWRDSVEWGGNATHEVLNHEITKTFIQEFFTGVPTKDLDWVVKNMQRAFIMIHPPGIPDVDLDNMTVAQAFDTFTDTGVKIELNYEATEILIYFAERAWDLNSPNSPNQGEVLQDPSSERGGSNAKFFAEAFNKMLKAGIFVLKKAGQAGPKVAKVSKYATKFGRFSGVLTAIQTYIKLKSFHIRQIHKGNGIFLKLKYIPTTHFDLFPVARPPAAPPSRFGNDIVTTDKVPYTITLKTHNPNFYVGAQSGGGHSTYVNANKDDKFAQLTLYDHNGGELMAGDWVSLQAPDGIHYFGAQDSGGTWTYFNRTLQGPWERLFLYDENGGQVKDGDRVSFKTQSGSHFLRAPNGGGVNQPLMADRDQIGIHETFTLNFLNQAKIDVSNDPFKDVTISTSSAQSNEGWQSIAGNYKSVSMGKNGDVWAVGTDSKVYKWDGNKFTHNPSVGGTDFNQLDVGPNGEVWAMGNDKSIWTYTQANGWKKVPIGITNQLSIGPDGDVWSMGTEASPLLYQWNGSTWELRPGTEFKQIDVGPGNSVVGVGHNEKVWKYSNGTWTQLPGVGFSYVTYSPEGTIYGAGSNKKVWRLDGNSWTQLPGAQDIIQAGPNDVQWGLNGTAMYVTANYQIKGWQTQSGDYKSVSMGKNGDVWSVGTDSKVYKWDGVKFVHNPSVGGTDFNQLDVGPNGEVWSMGNDKSIWTYTQANGWKKVPIGITNQVSIGPDGHVWSMGTEAEPLLYQWNGSTWELRPGTGFKQIDVGPGNSVVGVGHNEKVWKYANGSWTQLPGVGFSYVTYSPEGTIYGAGSNKKVWRLDGSNWTQLEGSYDQVQAGPNKNLWAINGTTVASGYFP